MSRNDVVKLRLRLNEAVDSRTVGDVRECLYELADHTIGQHPSVPTSAREEMVWYATYGMRSITRPGTDWFISAFTSMKSVAASYFKSASSL